MNSPDPFDRLVASWEAPEKSLPDLRRRVWRRIDVAKARRSVRFARAWEALLEAWPRQRPAVAWVLACVALGLVSAELRATRTPLRDIGRMATVYLQAIDPLLRDGAGAPP